MEGHGTPLGADSAWPAKIAGDLGWDLGSIGGVDTAFLESATAGAPDSEILKEEEEVVIQGAERSASSAQPKKKKPKKMALPRGADIVEYERPQLSYAQLAAEAIKATDDNRATVGDIYTWILEKHPFYRRGAPWWRNCIRHNLSMKKCFIRTVSELGNYWSLDEEEATKLFNEKRNPASWHNSTTGRKRRASEPESFPRGKPAVVGNASKRSRKREAEAAGDDGGRSTAVRISIGTQTETMSVSCQTEISCLTMRTTRHATATGLGGADASTEPCADLDVFPPHTAPVLLRGPKVKTGAEHVGGGLLQAQAPPRAAVALDGYTYPGDLEADMEGSFLKLTESFEEDDDADDADIYQIGNMRPEPLSLSWGGFSQNWQNSKEVYKNPFI